MENKDLCLALAQCDTESQVIRLLTTAGIWQNVNCWQFFGDIENNYSSIGNQQDKPENAIVEKFINSVDSMLTSECLKKGIIPDSSKAPASIKDALGAFFGIHDGKLTNITSTQRSKLADNICFVATGAKGNPSYTLIDKGEGQSPSKFKTTFLSLGKSNKLRIPFVQGKFNMGGTGVFRFCGTENGSQNVSLISSKRNPEIAKNEEDPLKNHWGFTVIRRDSAIEGTRSSSYKYLTSETGEILSFLAESLPLLPGKYPIAYANPLEWGCFMKFYEYQIGPLKTNVILDLNYKLSLLMPNIALPVKLYERRAGYNANSYESVLSGLSVRIDEDRSNNIEDGFPSTGILTAQGQTMRFSIYVFKRGREKNYTKDEGIIFTINGQTHGFLRKAFFNRKSVGLGYLSDSILVNLDCSDFDSRSREVLFMNSRDRLCNVSLKEDIETQLQDLLKNHSGLRMLKEKRRKEEIESKLHDQQPLAEVLKGILKNSPALSKLFLKGERLQVPFNNKSTKIEEVYIGKNFPTYFTLIKNYSANSPKEAHINSRFRIQFKTDANNNYFDRDRDSGILNVYINGKEVKDVSINLWNGYATLNVSIDEYCVGDILYFKTEVFDISKTEPFESDFFVKIYPPAIPGHGKPGERKPPVVNDGDNENSIPDRLALPTIIEVKKSEWQEYNFDEYSALKVKCDEENGHDFFVNIDNIYLQTELKHSKDDIELVQAKYKFGMVLVGLALINEYSKIDNSEEEIDIPATVYKISKGLSAIIIPMIDSLGKMEIDELHHVAETSDLG